jgi:hypothetical protein
METTNEQWYQFVTSASQMSKETIMKDIRKYLMDNNMDANTKLYLGTDGKLYLKTNNLEDITLKFPNTIKCEKPNDGDISILVGS